MTAEDSSMVTGCWAPTCALAPVGVVVTVRPSAPVWLSTATVTPAARTADRSDAVTTVPSPGPPRRREGVAGPTAAVYAGGGVVEPLSADPELPDAGRGVDACCAYDWPWAPGSAGAGWYQRSACGCCPGEAHAHRASGRGSG